MPYVKDLKEVSLADIAQVGGKNASLGQLLNQLSRAGIKVPSGFATTADAYQAFLTLNQLNQPLSSVLASLDVSNLDQLHKASQTVQQHILSGQLPEALKTDIKMAYDALTSQTTIPHHSIDISPRFSVAVRSSATAEDLPQASFAGQQATFLNVQGLDDVYEAVKRVYASLFTERAIVYRQQHGFKYDQVAMSVCIQRMIRSDRASSGVMFTLDTESGFDQVIFITAAYGLGETIVQGTVNPDEFYVHKPTLKQGHAAIISRELGRKDIKMIYRQPDTKNPLPVETVSVPEQDRARYCLSDEDVLTLAHQAVLIESEYGQAMDIEWAKDGESGEIYIVQARPETVQTQRKRTQVIERYRLDHSAPSPLVSGRSIGHQIGQGRANLIQHPSQMQAMQTGNVLVTDMTDPDWEPIMKRASAIVTNRGGRTCHAAIIARELGIPAVVGCQTATTQIKPDQPITVSCIEGEMGYVYSGELPYHVEHTEIATLPDIPVKLCLNLANPEQAFTYQQLPNHGVGLARLEFIISNRIGLHPNAALQYDTLPADLQAKIAKQTAAYPTPVDYYVEKMVEGIATIAAAFYPKPIIVRFSDFKSNEYANLLGGSLFEPKEENPMLGYRGASRYLSPLFRPCFELECRAIRRVRTELGLTNTQVMFPFVRTVAEAEAVVALLAEFGLKRGDVGTPSVEGTLKQAAPANNVPHVQTTHVTNGPKGRGIASAEGSATAVKETSLNTPLNTPLNVYMMCEIPSNALLAEEFLAHFDGFSIGSNDLTQLTLGLDRDSALVADCFDERNEAILALLATVIQTCRRLNKYVGICGQGPSDHLDFAKWLMAQGIEAMSLSPDSIVSTWVNLASRY